MKQVSKNNSYLFLIGVGLAVIGLLAYLVFLGNDKSVPKNEDDIAKLSSQSQSDSIDSIEKDLNATDLSNIDQELQSIDKELNNSN